MGELTKSAIIYTYLDSHPSARATDVYEHVNVGRSEKDPITLPYCRKHTTLWRKKHIRRQDKKKTKGPTTPTTQAIDPHPSPLPTTMDPELLNILSIMQNFQSAGVRVQFREIHEYMKERGSLTNAEEEVKCNLRTMSPQQLTSVILQSESSLLESSEEK